MSDRVPASNVIRPATLSDQNLDLAAVLGGQAIPLISPIKLAPGVNSEIIPGVPVPPTTMLSEEAEQVIQEPQSETCSYGSHPRDAGVVCGSSGGRLFDAVPLQPVTLIRYADEFFDEAIVEVGIDQCMVGITSQAILLAYSKSHNRVRVKDGFWSLVTSDKTYNCIILGGDVDFGDTTVVVGAIQPATA